jgi:uncharacterized membrane protein
MEQRSGKQGDWVVAVCVGALLVAAAALRLWGIGAQSLWYDEVLTTKTAVVPLSDLWSATLEHENTPPLYFLLMNLWVRVFGMSDVSLRIPSAILGVGAVAAMYHLGKATLARPVGLVAATLLTFSRYHIGYSQEARTYSLMFLLMLLSCLCFVRLLRGERSRWLSAGYAASTSLALYAHPYAIFTVLAQNLYYFGRLALLRGRGDGGMLRRWLMLQAAVAVLFGPWLRHTLSLAATGLPWMYEPTPPIHALQALAGSKALLALLAGLWLLAVIRAAIRREPIALLSALLLACPILIPYLMSTPRNAMFVTRYGIVALAGMYLLAAQGAAMMPRWAASAATAGVVALSMAGFVPGVPNYPWAYWKPDIRSAAAFVGQHAERGATLLLPDGHGSEFVFRYYCDRQDLRFQRRLRPQEPELAAYWMMSVHSNLADSAKDLGYTVVSKETFDRQTVYRFARLPATAPAATRPATQP